MSETTCWSTVDGCLLHLIMDDLPVNGQIHVRIIRFYNWMYKNTCLNVTDRQQTVVGRMWLTV